MYQAKYFDGKTSKTHNASVHTSTLGWSIQYTDELTQQKKQLFWNINDIKKSKVYTKGLVSFTYGNTFPFQKIESSDTNFINHINNSDQRNLSNKLDTWLHKSVLKSLGILTLLIIGLGASMYFFVVPYIAVRFAENLPKEYVREFGKYTFNQVSIGLDIDEKQSENLQNFVDELNLGNQFPIKVYVANSKELNAFAISGGKFIIYSSLLEKIETEHQLAALIGHEVSHIEKRHMLKGVARGVSSSIFISILIGDISFASLVLSKNADKIMQLSHSRSLEKEADINGLEILDKNNLDQHGMVELFNILKENSLIEVPAFLNSHPIIDDRIEYSKKIAEQQRPYPTNQVLKDKWNIIKSYYN